VWRFTSIYVYTAHFDPHTEITLQDVPNREYTLRLFVDNVERQVQRKDPYVLYFPNMCTERWIRVYRDVSPTSQMLINIEVRMKSGHLFRGKYREASEVIDLRGLFNEYWCSNTQEFIVMSQSLSPSSPRIPDSEGQRLLP